ncbi:MAG TPA: Hpt domain-containing protein, partial [Duganella sp.]|uniref:Hpt domain-containing protein n=1 Tax=Duganella sp. TaxID=1904440 RepID=UPI002ED39EC7
MEDDRRRAQQAGMNAHVAKPIDVEDLIAVLTAVVPARAPAAAPAAQADSAPRPAADAAGDTAAALPGIDVDAALARLGGDRDALTSLLKRFGQSQGGTVDEVRALLAGGQQEAATQALHRLRGVASNLGAGEVARLTAAAEAALRDGAGQPGGALDAALDALAAALAIVTDGARALDTGARDMSAGNTSAHDMPQKLAELQGLLQNNNLKALEYFRELRPALAATAQSGALADAVETLDFATAGRLVEIMLQRKESA